MRYVAVESYRNPSYNIVLCEGTLLECRAHTEKYIADRAINDPEDVERWEYNETDQIYWYEDGGYDPSCINLMPVD